MHPFMPLPPSVGMLAQQLSQTDCNLGAFPLLLMYVTHKESDWNEFLCRALIRPVLMRVMQRHLSTSFTCWRDRAAVSAALKQMGKAICRRLMQWRVALVFDRWQVYHS